MNATFAGGMARPGNVGFISQSGALGTAILDWSLRELVGFSCFISIGSMVDIGWGDLIDYLGDDTRTRSIVLYMESIGDARSFLSAAREVALTKPIIVIKAGRSEAAVQGGGFPHRRAYRSATRSSTPRSAAAACCGSTTSQTCSIWRRCWPNSRGPKGPRLTILTNAGGPALLATDALITSGGELAELSPVTMEKLNALLPAHWSHNNPVDILGDAAPERYAKAVEIVAQDPGSDGLLVVLTPQAITDPTRTAEQLRPFAKIEDKPILASWMGGADVAAGESILNRANIPTFPIRTPRRAPSATCGATHQSARACMRHLPDPGIGGDGVGPGKGGQVIFRAPVPPVGHCWTRCESKRLLAAYGIPIVETRTAASEAEAGSAGGGDRLSRGS